MLEVVVMPDNPQFWATAARWCLDEWGAQWPDDTLEDYYALYRSSASHPDAVPVVLAATDAGQLLGVVTLIADDELPGATEGPWLAACFVDPAHRGQGVGKALVKAAEQKAKDLGYGDLYLFTWSERDWYARLGWVPMRSQDFCGQLTFVMHKNLVR